MHQFRTRHKELAGFSEFFDAEVRPVLIQRDVARKEAVKKGTLIGGAVCAALLLLAGLAATRYGFNPATVVAFFLSAIVGMVIYWVCTHEIQKETKSRLVNAVVGYIGWTFMPDVESYDLAPFEGLFLLPRGYDRASLEDSLFGEAHGAQFFSVEAHLEEKRRDSDGDTKWVTVFRGQVMTLDFPTRTFGRTIALRDAGWFNRKKKDDMKRVGLVDPVFEKIFECYSTDQVEGRVILDPAFMQRMVDLETAISGKNVRFGFENDTLYIAIETGNQFEAGSMLASLDRPEPTQKILDEIGVIFDIVDGLAQKPGRANFGPLEQ